MVDAMMIVFICIIGILLIIGDIYLLAYYCHPEDKGVGSANLSKVIVVSINTNNIFMYIGISNVTCLGTGINVTFRCI